MGIKGGKSLNSYLFLPLIVVAIFKVTDAINLLLANGYFKKIQRCQNHRQRPQIGAEKRCKFSDAL